MKISFIILLLLTSSVFPQQLFISGSVKDFKTNENLSYANIRIDNSTSGTSANKEGNYELKLNKGIYKLIASYIGYYSDTLIITLTSDLVNIDFFLKETGVELPEVTVMPGINPALEIIQKAIQQRKQREASIESYEFEAYTKGIIKSQQELSENADNNLGVELGIPDSIPLKVTGIIENQSKGYFKKPGNYKEIITARKQTANIPPSINTLTGGRLIKNFYEENIRFFDKELPGPLEDGAIDYYYFYIDRIIQTDNYPVYKIYISPDDPSDPGFEGYLYITEKTYHLIKVELTLNRAAKTGGLFDTVKVLQQFSPFNNIYMPVDYRLIVNMDLFGLAKLGFELNTILYDYKINEHINDNFFDNAIVTVLPDADKKDKLFWENIQSLPNTVEEIEAYKRIDSLENIPSDFWSDFSFLSTRINLTNHISVNAPLAFYHFNRVEGHALDFGIYYENALDERLNSSLLFSYGFGDKKLKTDLSASYLFGDYRTYSITAKLFNKTDILFGSSENYNEFTATLLSLISKYEFRDYYYSNGFELGLAGEIFPVLLLRTGFENHTDKNAKLNSNFSFFAKDKKVKENPSVFETKINAFKLGFTLDFRKYIEDGLFRRRTSEGNSYIIFDGDLTYSSHDIKSKIDFTQYELFIHGRLNTFKSAGFNYQLYGLYSNGAIPYQMLYAFPGNIDLTAKSFTFRTLEVNEALGDKAATFHIEHDFNDELFRLLNIPGIKNWELQLEIFFNGGFSDTGSKTKDILPIKIRTFKNPFYELGFAIGHVLFPIQFEFAWKLNHRDGNNFRFGMNSFIY